MLTKNRILFILLVLCVFSPGCSCRKKTDLHIQPMQTKPQQQLVPENPSDDTKQGDEAAPISETNIEQKNSGTADKIPVSTPQSVSTSLTKAEQQLKNAEAKRGNGDLSGAYVEALKAWQAGRNSDASSQNADAVSAEWAVLHERAEAVMQEIATQTPNAGQVDKPLVITGK